VLHAGTYSANVVAAAAGATLEYMQTNPVFEYLNQLGTTLIAGLKDILTHYSIPHHFHGTPAMFGISFSETEPKDWRAVLQTDLAFAEKLFVQMHQRGILIDASPQQPWYLCAAHTTPDITETDSFILTKLNKH